MLEVVGASLVGLLINILGQGPVKLEAIPLVSWQEAAIFRASVEPDAKLEAIVEQYLEGLSALGMASKAQSIWIQSDWTELANYQGTVPVSAASLTKIATTLAALDKWGVNHRFETSVYATGSVKDGVLQGDLAIQGSGDPLFVWEEAIAVGNRLHQLGIRQVTGNLVVVGNFSINYKSNPAVAGQLLKQGLDARLWPPAALQSHAALPPGTPRPQVAIAGTVLVQPTLPEAARLLLRHQSLPLAEIIKQMNIYSNNEIAQMLADSVGGAETVAQLAAKKANVPPAEIQLVNGSGLGVDNRISPRAVCAMLRVLERELASQSLKVADLFPLAGRDRLGTMKRRSIPAGITVKTGTLNQVSALAGVIPTQERGPVWFAIINHGNKIEQFRAEQDRLLQRLSQHWQLMPVTATIPGKAYLGDPRRNLQVGS